MEPTLPHISMPEEPFGGYANDPRIALCRYVGVFLSSAAAEEAAMLILC